MFRSLFRIFYRPQETLHELLEERRNGRSWRATILLVVTNVLAMLFLGIFAFHKLTDLLRAAGYMPSDLETSQALSVSFAFVMLYVLGYALFDFVFGRYVFGWIVQLGLRMVAGREYPRDREERREKAKLVRLIHPYTLWMSELPRLFSYVTLTLLIALMPWPNLKDLTGQNAQEAMISLLVAFLIWATVTGLLTFGLWIYMIVVRTSAIQKIYRVSAAQAFWGPFVMYAILYFLGFVARIIWFLISLLTGDAPQNDVNFM